METDCKLSKTSSGKATFPKLQDVKGPIGKAYNLRLWVGSWLFDAETPFAHLIATTRKIS